MKKSKRIPIKAAKEFANQYDKDQVIILCWDKETNSTWVTTYGKSKADCEQAAEGGNEIKNFSAQIVVQNINYNFLYYRVILQKRQKLLKYCTETVLKHG